MADFIQQLEWMARILMAGACGGIIGYERESIAAFSIEKKQPQAYNGTE